jgi:hypothetical protein
MWSLRHLAPAVVASVLATGSSTGATADPFSFRGLTLGTQLTELRRLRFPEAPSARVVCTQDPEAAELRPSADFNAQPDEVKMGVMVCGIFNFARMFANSPSSLPPEWIPAKVQAAGVEVSPAFWYVPADTANPASTEPPRLFRISMRSNSAYWNETKQAFIRRYGTPESAEKIPFTGYRGARLDNERIVWSNRESTITLTKRSQLPNQLLIVFEHDTLTPSGSKLGSATGPGLPATRPASVGAGPGPG